MRLYQASVTDLPRVLGVPSAAAGFKLDCADFQVDEILGFTPSGEGEHFLLQIRKQNLNTQDLVQLIAKLAGIRSRDIGYCGLKDKRAITSQWFSVGLAGKPPPDWEQLTSDLISVLRVERHSKKLRPGTHAANQFRLCLRSVHGDTSDLETRLQSLAVDGYPNYFGSQRFGQDGKNLLRARKLLLENKRYSKHHQGLYISALRAALFNQVLAARIKAGTWNTALPGDLLNLAGSRSVFSLDKNDPEIAARLVTGDVHITGPLCGREKLTSADLARDFEKAVLADCEQETAALEKFGVEAARRPLRALAKDLSWQWLQQDLILAFELEPGCYASSLVRELVNTELLEEA